MSKLPTIPLKTYEQLVSAIKKEIAEGKRIIRHQTALSHWRTGQYIFAHISYNQSRANYGAHLFARLEKDLDIGERTLQRAVKFYRGFPIPSAQTELQWNHYQALLTIKDDTKRLAWEQKAIKQGLTGEELRQLIKKERVRSVKSKKPVIIEQLPVSRGKLFTYKVLDNSFASEKGLVAIDCGFDIRRTIAKNSASRLDEGSIVTAQKQGSGYIIEKSDASENELYTYPCRLERVIDGDTIWVHIDCGLGTWVRERVRLNAIDTPELKTLAGEKAKRFVQRVLKNCAVFVIKTYKTDKYNRYLADIFYLPGENDPARVASEGLFLNQELLDSGHARVWEG